MSNDVWGLFKSLFKSRPNNLRRRQLTFAAEAVALSRHEYAGAIYSGVVDMILTGVRNTEWRLVAGGASDWGFFELFLRTRGDEVVGRLIHDGCVSVSRDAGGLWDFTQDGAAADYTFRSTDLRLWGCSTYSIIRPDLDYLNNIVNAANTSISRLGVMAVFSPKSNEYGNKLTREELDVEEERLQADYGVLDAQKVVKFFSHSYDMSVINLAGENLQLSDRFTQAVKMLCGKLKVPFELVPCAVLGNTNQTGVYQGEAVKRLYQTIAEYQKYLLDFCRSFGYEVEAINPQAPQDYATEAEDLRTKQINNILAAETAGYISHEEAIKLYRDGTK